MQPGRPAREDSGPENLDKSVGGLSLGCCVEPSSAIWMLITLLALSFFLIIFFCVLGVACRWIYKRRMRKKCEALKNKYVDEENHRKAEEVKAKRLGLRPILPYHQRDDNNKQLVQQIMALKNKQQRLAGQPPVCVAANTTPPLIVKRQIPPPAVVQQSSLIPVRLTVPETSHPALKVKPEEKKKETGRNEKQETAKKSKKEEVEAPLKERETNDGKKQQLDEGMKTARSGGKTQKTLKQLREKGQPDSPYWKDKLGDARALLEEAVGSRIQPGVSAWSSSTLVNKKPSEASRLPASLASPPLRPPNAYEMRNCRSTAPPHEDLQSPRVPVGQQRPLPPEGFSHLRVAVLKRDCMPSFSDPAMPRRS